VGRKSPILTYPTSIWRLRLGVIPLEFRQDFWFIKLESPALSYGVVCAILQF